MSDNKSLCDTCLYKYSCEDSDAGISWANHSVCYGYASVENEKEVRNDLSVLFVVISNKIEGENK